MWRAFRRGVLTDIAAITCEACSTQPLVVTGVAPGARHFCVLMKFAVNRTVLGFFKRGECSRIFLRTACRRLQACRGSCRSWQQHDDLDDRLDLGARRLALTATWKFTILELTSGCSRSKVRTELASHWQWASAASIVIAVCSPREQHDNLDDRLDLSARCKVRTAFEAWFLLSPVIAIATSMAERMWPALRICVTSHCSSAPAPQALQLSLRLDLGELMVLAQTEP